MGYFKGINTIKKEAINMDKERCPFCKCEAGKLHMNGLMGCPVEECPVCHGKLHDCGCFDKKLIQYEARIPWDGDMVRHFDKMYAAPCAVKEKTK